ncbi:MAG: hypothetical protein ACODAE_06185, partial [Gemmatimonadota bacterium]
DETLPLVDAAELPASPYGLRPRGAAGPAGVGPGAGPGGGPGPGIQAREFSVGPFECEADGSLPGLEVGSPDFDLTDGLEMRVAFEGSELRAIAATGTLRATFSYEPRLEAAFTGEVGCEAELATLVLPITGALSWFVGAQVPVGVGMDLDAKLEIAEVGFDVTAEAEATVELAITCPGAGGDCAASSDADGSADAGFEFVSPDPTEQFRVKLGAYGYVFANLSVGSPISEKLQFDAFGTTAGVEQIVDLATAEKQAEDTAYASGYWLVASVEGEPGSDLTKAAERINEFFDTDLDVDRLAFELADTLARSPTGTFEISPETVAPGDSTETGEMATFTATLDPVDYLGADVVDRVEFLWWQEEEDEEGGGGDNGGSGGTGEYTLEPGRPACTDVEGGGGKTEFECETDFLEEHEGTQTFYAFTRAELSGVPLPVPLEIAPHAPDSVEVGGCAWLEDFHGSQIQIVHDTASGGSGGGSSTSIDAREHGDIGASIAATSEPGEWDTPPAFSVMVRATDFLCASPDDSVSAGDTVSVRFRVTGELSENPGNNTGGSSSAEVYLTSGAVFFNRGTDFTSDSEDEPDDPPLSFDEEVVVPMEVGQPSMLSAEVDVSASSGGGYEHEATARFRYSVIRVEDDSGAEIPGVVIQAISGTDYTQGAGEAPNS